MSADPFKHLAPPAHVMARLEAALKVNPQLPLDDAVSIVRTYGQVDVPLASFWIGGWLMERRQQEDLAKQLAELPLSPAMPKPERTWPAFDFWCEAFLTSLRGLLDPVLHAQMGVDAVHQARKMADEAVGLYFTAEAKGIAEIAEVVKFANDAARRQP